MELHITNTWKALHEALEPHGLRTPFWGTLSRIGTTVGVSLSQNALARNEAPPDPMRLTRTLIDLIDAHTAHGTVLELLENR